MIKFILASLFIAGFSVGVGFLAIPTVVGLTGFWIGMVAIILVWLFGIVSGQLYLEAFLAVPSANHFTSLTRKLSSPLNTVITSLSFLFFNYCVLVTYYFFLYELFSQLISNYSLPFSTHVCSLLFTLLVACIIFIGRTCTIWSIVIIFLGYLSLFLYDFIQGKPTSLPLIQVPTKGYYIFFSIPAIFNASFYQSIMPTLIQFLKRDRKTLNRALWVGYSLSMLVLTLWIWLTLRPGAYDKFLAAFETKATLAEGILFLEELPLFKTIFRFLGIFAVVTSFLSACISLVDYFGDLFIKFLRHNIYLKRFLIILLTLIPSLILSWFRWDAFLTFSTLSTAIAEFLLATVLPISWVWSVRYIHRLPYAPILFGGKKMMVIMIFASTILFFLLGTIPVHQLDW